MAVSESPFLIGLNVGNPQVIIVDEGYEVRISGADLWVHTSPWTLGLDIYWLYRNRLLKPTETILVSEKFIPLGLEVDKHYRS